MTSEGIYLTHVSLVLCLHCTMYLADLLQRSHACQRLKELHAPYIWPAQQSAECLAFFVASTSKCGAGTLCFKNFHFQMRFAPQQRAIPQHLNFQKCSGDGYFLHSDFKIYLAPQWRSRFQPLTFQKCSKPVIFLGSFDLEMCFLLQGGVHIL